MERIHCNKGKFHKCIALWLMLLASVTACRQSVFTAQEKNDVVAEVNQMMHAYHEAIRNEGLMAEFRYLDQSPYFFWKPPGYASSITFDSVAIILQQNASLFRSVDNSWDSLNITALSRTSASYTGILRSTTVDTSGKVSEYVLLESGMLIKRNNKWKFLSGYTCTVSE